MAEMIRHLNFVMIAFVLGFSATRSSSQKEDSLTQSNECRHFAIMGSDSTSTSYSARCAIPTKLFKNETSLFDLITSDEWSWVYDHNGSVTGQVLVRTSHSVYMISQKDCLDIGDARGPRIRSVYERFDNETPPSNVIGDFDFSRPNNNDAYMECVKNKAQWDSLLPWFPNRTLPEGMVQMVREAVGGHSRVGQKLHEFNFTYSKDKLDETFRQLVTAVLNEKKLNKREQPNIVSGSPVTLSSFPFETGLSIIGSRSPNNPNQLVKHFYRDNSNLAWHRALQAKFALTNLQDPPPSAMPNEINNGQLVSTVALTFVAIFLFERTLKEAIRIRNAAIGDWDNPTGTLAMFDEDDGIGNLQRLRIFNMYLLNADNQPRFYPLLEYLFLSQPQGSLRASRAGTIDIFLAFVTAITSMAAAFLEFRDSKYRYQRIFISHSGGVITYGPSRQELSIDSTNTWAGAEFSVNHWLALNISKEGYKWLMPLVYTVCTLFILYMFYVFFIYSLRREHDLDFELIRDIFRPVKRVILSAQNLLGRFLFNVVKHRKYFHVMVLVSYESVFLTVFRKLAVHFGYQDLSSNEIPKLCATASGFHRFDIKEFLPDQIQVGPVHNPRAGFVFRNEGITVPRNEIAKCAEILAADRFGMLGRIQALALMYSRTAAKAADRFVNDNQLPDTNEIQQLALIFYVRNVVIPDGRGAPVLVGPNEAQFINVGARLRGVDGQTLDPDHLLKPNNPRKICAVIGRRPRASDANVVGQTVERQAQDDDNPNAVPVRDEEWHSDNVMYLAV